MMRADVRLMLPIVTPSPAVRVPFPMPSQDEKRPHEKSRQKRAHRPSAFRLGGDATQWLVAQASSWQIESMCARPRLPGGGRALPGQVAGRGLALSPCCVLSWSPCMGVGGR